MRKSISTRRNPLYAAPMSIWGRASYARQRAQLFGPCAEIHGDELDGLFQIAKDDGVVHAREVEILEHKVRRVCLAARALNADTRLRLAAI